MDDIIFYGGGLYIILWYLFSTIIEDHKNQEKALKNIGLPAFDNRGTFLGTPEQIVVMSINPTVNNALSPFIVFS